VIQPFHALWLQVVGAAQGGPAVLAVHKLVRKTERQIRVLRQVADRLDVKAVSLFFAHGEGVGVVEAQRLGHAQAALAERRAQAVAGDVFAGQQLLQDGAGIFRIGVDLAVAQGVPQEARAAKLIAVPDAKAGFAKQLRHHRAQQHVLGELLGADGELRFGWLLVLSRGFADR